MAINSVDMSKALKNEAYAAQVIRSGKCSGSERSQLAAQWGSDKITKWESVDSTQYEITDDDKSTARTKGEKRAEEGAKTDKDGNVNNEGFDGKSDGVESAVGTAAVGAGSAVAAGVATASAVAILTTKTADEASKKAFTNGWLAAVVGAAMLAVSLILKAMNPNAEQAQACDNMAPVMQDSQNELGEQQSALSETTNDVIESTDELSEASEEANKNTEAAQKDYEKLQARYQELVAKQEAAKSGGEPLTDAEKAEFQQLSGMLGTAFENLQNIKIEGDESLEEAKEAVEEKQEVYDNAAMKMEEVQEITDFSAEFDEATVDNAKMVKTAAYVGIAGSALTVAAGASHLFKWITGESVGGAIAMATGAAAGVTFASVVKDQNNYIERAEAGVNNRQATEEVNLNTNDVYEEKLDNYAGSVDMMGEIEFTESTATETQIVELSDTQPTDNGEDATANSPLGTPTSSDTSDVNPFAPPSSNNNDEGKTDSVDKADDDNSNPFANPDDKKEEV